MDGETHHFKVIMIRVFLLILPLLIYAFLLLVPSFRPPERLLFGVVSMFLIAFYSGLKDDKRGLEAAKLREEAYSDPVLRSRNFHNSFLMTHLLPLPDKQLLIRATICTVIMLASVATVNQNFHEFRYFEGTNGLYTGLVLLAGIPIGRACGSAL